MPIITNAPRGVDQIYLLQLRVRAASNRPTTNSELNDVLCESNFVEFFDNINLKNKLFHGFMSFYLLDDELWTIVTYLCQWLSPKERHVLCQFTLGELSNGIGRGFEQEPARYEDRRRLSSILPKEFLHAADSVATLRDSDLFISPYDLSYCDYFSTWSKVDKLSTCHWLVDIPTQE